MSHDHLLSEPNEAPFALSNLPLTSAALAANALLKLNKSYLLIVCIIVFTTQVKTLNKTVWSMKLSNNSSFFSISFTDLMEGMILLYWMWRRVESLSLVAMQTGSLQAATVNFKCDLLLQVLFSTIIWFRWKMQHYCLNCLNVLWRQHYAVDNNHIYLDREKK